LKTQLLTLLRFILFFFNILLWAQTPTEEQQKIFSSDPVENGQFGISTDISGDYAISGAIGVDDFRGAVYLFHFDGHDWNQIAKLTMSDAAPSTFFGKAIAISGDYIVAGCEENKAAYIYKQPVSGWTDMTETQKIEASDAQADDAFGYSVGIDGDYIVIGDLYQDNGGSLTDNKGAAYVFHNSAGIWTEEAKLIASDVDIEDYFGCDVSISNSTIIVGSKGDDDVANYSGSAYIFTNETGTWEEKAKLTASDPTTSDGLGFTVDVYGDYAIASAYWKNVSGVGSGAAYVYKKPTSGWANMTQTARLTPSNGVAYDYFSRNIAITDQYAVASTHYEHDGGQVYFYEMPGSGWVDMTENKILKPSGDVVVFGKSLSLTNEKLIVGDFGDASYAGAAYIYAPEDTFGVVDYKNTSFSIYPNPNNGIFYLKMNKFASFNYFVTISNNLGQIVYQTQLEENVKSINLSHLMNGIYSINLINEDSIFSSKIILNN
jgi:hypothetical protein